MDSLKELAKQQGGIVYIEQIEDWIAEVVTEIEELEEEHCQCFRMCAEQCFIERVTEIVRGGLI